MLFFNEVALDKVWFDYLTNQRARGPGLWPDRRKVDSPVMLSRFEDLLIGLQMLLRLSSMDPNKDIVNVAL